MGGSYGKVRLVLGGVALRIGGKEVGAARVACGGVAHVGVDPGVAFTRAHEHRRKASVRQPGRTGACLGACADDPVRGVEVELLVPREAVLGRDQPHVAEVVVVPTVDGVVAAVAVDGSAGAALAGDAVACGDARGLGRAPCGAAVLGAQHAFLGAVAAAQFQGDEGVAVVVKGGDGHEVVFGGVGCDGVGGRPGLAPVVGAHELGTCGPFAGDLVGQPDGVAPRGHVWTFGIAQEDARVGGHQLGCVERAVVASHHVQPGVGFAHEDDGVARGVQDEAGALVAKIARRDVDGFHKIPRQLRVSGRA